MSFSEEWVRTEPMETNAAVTKRHAACAWVGMAEDREHVEVCGRPAREVIFDTSGRPHYACDEHLAQMEARFSSGVRRQRPIAGPARPYPESIP
jgi:hypothetical protein